MENKDRVSEILSDNGGLEPEMLEKLSESCDVLSDEQKNRIFDIIQVKENGTEQINSENEKNEETVRVIEYRKTNNTVKIIAAVAACACIVTGLTFFSGKNDENLIPGDDSAKTTTVYETAKFAEISEGADSFVTSEQMPAVTVIETVISAEEVTGIVKPAETAPVAEAGEQVTEKTSETTSPEVTEAVSETEKIKELRNLKDEMLAQTWGEGGAYDIVTGAMRDAGFNEDQIYIMKNTAMFTRFADELDGLNHSIELDSSSYGNTGFSYESFRELIGMFFTDDAQQLYYAGSSGVLEARSPEHIFDASDNDGELRLQFGTPVRHGPSACEVIITEKTDSSVKFILRCKKSESEGAFAEFIDKYDNMDDVLAAINADAKKSVYYGPRFKGVEYSENNGFLTVFDYEEEMVKTADGWRFKVYSNFSLS